MAAVVFCALGATAAITFMHIWELLNADTWLREHVADNGKGLIVSPHSSRARRFSLLGGLIHCYIPVGQIWTLEFENMRSAIFSAIVGNKELRKEMKHLLGHTSLSKIPLYELNQAINWFFVHDMLESLSQNFKK